METLKAWWRGLSDNVRIVVVIAVLLIILVVLATQDMSWFPGFLEGLTE